MNLRKIDIYKNRLEKIKIFQEKNKHFCEEDNKLDIRFINNKNGGVAYVYQCIICGRRRGRTLKKAVALLENRTPIAYDENLSTDLFKRYRRTNNIEYKIKKLLKIELGIKELDISLYKDNKDEFYNLLSEKYNERELIHYTRNLNDELIKNGIEEFKESYTFEYDDENKLKVFFRKYFKTDFFIYPEVEGTHNESGKKVIIDFIIAPRQHLLDQGFEKDFFGVEVKYLNPESDIHSKTSKAFWQTITYNYSTFNIRGERILIPRSTFLFSNLSFKDEQKLFPINKNINSRSAWFAYLELANHAGVGILNIRYYEDKPVGWSFDFAINTYYVKTIKDDKIQYKLYNKDHINKVRVGNFQ